MIVGYWCTKVCVGLFKNPKYFYFDVSLRVAKRKIFYWSTSKFIFSDFNRKILKARHPLVAYRVQIEIVQFVWLCVIMRRRVIQQSEHVIIIKLTSEYDQMRLTTKITPNNYNKI